MHNISINILLSIVLVSLLSVSAGCSLNKSQGNTMSYKYLALGDSYTIGERVADNERWPNQLVAKIESNSGASFEPVEIIATTGWTTDELKEGISKVQPKTGIYDFVSLLIGVNNQYRGYPISDFEVEFEELLKQAISYAKDKSHVFVVSIPDYGVTPFAAKSDPVKIGTEVANYNSISERIVKKYGIAFFDIYQISKKAADDLTYIAEDKLHPSGKMYGEWADLIYPWLNNQVNQ